MCHYVLKIGQMFKTSNIQYVYVIVPLFNTLCVIFVDTELLQYIFAEYCCAV
jgi:hypothetical protein